jgi:hypothetical protein
MVSTTLVRAVPVRRGRRILLTVFAALVLCALLACSTWVVAVHGRHREATGVGGAGATRLVNPRAAAADPVAGTSAVQVWAAAGITNDMSSGTAPVVLPRGAEAAGSWRAGFPRTARGAIAAAVEYTSHWGCLDTACVEALRQRAFSPHNPAARSAMIAAMRANRVELGLPAGEAVPAGATESLSPMAFQLDLDDSHAAGVTDDLLAQVRVVLLCYQALAGPAISPTNRMQVISVPLHWENGRWLVVPGDRSYQDLLARPGTENAKSKGWRDFVA